MFSYDTFALNCLYYLHYKAFVHCISPQLPAVVMWGWMRLTPPQDQACVAYNIDSCCWYKKHAAKLEIITLNSDILPKLGRAELCLQLKYSARQWNLNNWIVSIQILVLILIDSNGVRLVVSLTEWLSSILLGPWARLHKLVKLTWFTVEHGTYMCNIIIYYQKVSVLVSALMTGINLVSDHRSTE